MPSLLKRRRRRGFALMPHEKEGDEDENSNQQSQAVKRTCRMDRFELAIRLNGRRRSSRRDGEKILICVYLLSVIVFPYSIKETNNIIRTANV